MKVFLSVIALFASVSVFACEPEARTILQISKIEKGEVGCTASFAIDLQKGDVWEPNANCPLDIDMVKKIKIAGVCCKYTVGEKVSGVIKEKEDGSYEFEGIRKAEKKCNGKMRRGKKNN